MDTKERRLQLGRAIALERSRQGISQARLAMMIGTSKAYLSGVECGKTNAGIDNIIKIADALGLAVNQLIEF